VCGLPPPRRGQPGTLAGVHCRFASASRELSFATIDEDVAWELARLRAAGIARVIVVGLTKPELGVPVVRVVIPGLEPEDPISAHIPVPRARALLEKCA